MRNLVQFFQKIQTYLISQQSLITQLQITRDLKSPLTGFDSHNIRTWKITGTATETFTFPPVFLRFINHSNLITGPIITRITCS